MSFDKNCIYCGKDHHPIYTEPMRIHESCIFPYVQELSQQLTKLTTGTISSLAGNTVLLSFNTNEDAEAFCKAREGE